MLHNHVNLSKFSLVLYFNYHCVKRNMFSMSTKTVLQVIIILKKQRNIKSMYRPKLIYRMSILSTSFHTRHKSQRTGVDRRYCLRQSREKCDGRA